jgi:hypothetical protein
MRVSGQRHAPAAPHPGKGHRYPLDRRLGGPQSRSGHEGYRKNPVRLPGIEPWSSSLVRHYTDWATPAPVVVVVVVVVVVIVVVVGSSSSSYLTALFQ